MYLLVLLYLASAVMALAPPTQSPAHKVASDMKHVEPSSYGAKPPPSSYAPPPPVYSTQPEATTYYETSFVTVTASVPYPVVTQIPDGQVEYPITTLAPPLVTQISDGQVEAPYPTAPAPKAPAPPAPPAGPYTASSPPVVTQIPDGQVQAPPASKKHKHG